MESDFFVDIHCHPSIKAYARSFANKPGKQSAKTNDPSSLWRTDAPSLFDKIKNYVVSLTNFIQSDATNLFRGRVAVTCLSFYPQEKGFFVNKLGTGLLSDTLTKLASEFGQERIDAIQKNKSYWDDLKMETAFVLQQENTVVSVDGHDVTYVIARSYDDIEMYNRTAELGVSVIIFVPTIEGGHIFDQLMDSTVPFNTFPKGVADNKIPMLLQRATELRESAGGLLRPAFLTLAHHFWNGLCGQARSLGNIIKCVVDQNNGLGTGLTEAGKEVLRVLLKDHADANGNPVPIVPIDIKHMSRRSRIEYFAFLDEEFPTKTIPILASHAGVTGLPGPGFAPATPAAQEGLFMIDDINFYDDEILRIEASGGVFGIQLDERRIASKQVLRQARGNISKRDILFSWSKLVWNQVRHVAEVLDSAGQYAWGIQSLGTDFDGIIDPINGYWTSKQIDDLDDYLLKHAYNYLKGIKVPCPLVQPRNNTISPEEVVERVMTSNALNFLSRFYRG